MTARFVQYVVLAFAAVPGTLRTPMMSATKLGATLGGAP